MKRIASLRQKKGFTLVECIIAIAVFAVLTSMVVMIVGNAVSLQKQASDAESELNNLVDNVVLDYSKRVYGENSETLEMIFGNVPDSNPTGNGTPPNFRMSYTSSDAYRTYIKCKHCGKISNVTDYLNYIYNTTSYINDPEKKNYKACHWFGKYDTEGAPGSGETSYFMCPECEQKIEQTDIILKCEACGQIQPMIYGSTRCFQLNSANANFKCLSCGNEAVRQVTQNIDGTYSNVTDELSSTATFLVGDMKANGIRYGRIDLLEKDQVKDLMKFEGGEDMGARMFLQYTKPQTPSKPGVYTLTLDNVKGFDALDASNKSGQITIELPGCYVVTLVDNDANDGSDNNLLVYSFHDGTDYSKSDKRSSIIIANIFNGNKNSITVKFSLENYANKHTFEEDYDEDCKANIDDDDEVALARYWFQTSSCAENKAPAQQPSCIYPRDDSTIFKPAVTNATDETPNEEEGD